MHDQRIVSGDGRRRVSGHGEEDPGQTVSTVKQINGDHTRRLGAQAARAMKNPAACS